MQQVQSGADSRAVRPMRNRVRKVTGGSSDAYPDAPLDAHPGIIREARSNYHRELLPEIRLEYTREDLQNRYQEILAECQRTGEPVHISADGVEEMVVMSSETYRRFCEMELRSFLFEGLADDLAGNVTPMEDVFAELERDMEDGTL